MEKKKLGRAALQTVIMDQVRSAAGCQALIGVLVFEDFTSRKQNWQAGLTFEVPGPGHAAAFQVVRNLQGQYNCTF
jgi:hypothetical protein